MKIETLPSPLTPLPKAGEGYLRAKLPFSSSWGRGWGMGL